VFLLATATAVVPATAIAVDPIPIILMAMMEALFLPTKDRIIVFLLATATAVDPIHMILMAIMEATKDRIRSTKGSNIEIYKLAL